MLLVIWFVPRFAENIEYSLTRGRERAEVEIAREQLAGHQAEPFVQAFGQVAKSIGPSVVHIDTIKSVTGHNDGLDIVFGGRGLQEFSQEQGSGVVVDNAGYVLTNNHVVDGAAEIEVSLSDGRKVGASVIGVDPATDLAVIKIDAEGLIPAPWGDSEKLPVGAPVWAVGNPYGLDRSVTFGIISAKSRRGLNSNPYQYFLQTDAAVNPGNSGGPLVNINGEVVGINTAIVGRSYQGISFAIPSEIAQEVYEQLRANKHVIRGYLGVQLDEVTKTEPKSKQPKENPIGAAVLMVVPGGPAYKAGVEPGDIIVGWDGHAIDNATTLRLLIARSEVGSEVECVVVRDGQEKKLTVKVAEQPFQQSRSRGR